SQGPPTLSLEEFGDKLALLKSSGATMRHIPKRPRLLCAQVFTGLIEEVTKTNTVFNWQKLLIFPHAVLRAHRKTDGVQNGTKWVKDKLNSWILNRSIH